MITKPIIHEAITLNPDPTEFMPVEVNSAFPEGEPSRLTPVERAKIDDLIEAVPDKNDTRAINYWRDMDDKKVYLEGWCDKCLAGTGFPPMEGGEWDDKIGYMVRVGHRTLIEKQEERNRPFIGPGHWPLVEGGFREFEAGDKDWLYGVTWGVYEKAEGGNPEGMGLNLKTSVDTCLKEIADWYIENRREITEPELEAILQKHCEGEAEVQKFIRFLETEPGQLRFKTLLGEKGERLRLTPSGIKAGTHPYRAPDGIPTKVWPVRASTGEGYSLYDRTEGVWFGRRRETYQEEVKAADKENRRLWEAYKALHPE